MCVRDFYMIQDEINLLKQRSPASIDRIDFNQNFILIIVYAAKEIIIIIVVLYL